MASHVPADTSARSKRPTRNRSMEEEPIFLTTLSGLVLAFEHFHRTASGSSTNSTLPKHEAPASTISNCGTCGLSRLSAKQSTGSPQNAKPPRKSIVCRVLNSVAGAGRDI
eukprot:CAMPEP_0179451960 /NCGR_PEP_ID=MMETSP0799-20121207/35957_1 /TAXON_ID=46947 /ORGANISM="Geminigera cryophila, Strain CCMP2564" /LENGTH=110 /DNA_ID=CAMNT_0021247627 /DNA_START=24 /DNA_END=356 /DNA_ORIENTATION=+